MGLRRSHQFPSAILTPVSPFLGEVSELISQGPQATEKSVRHFPSEVGQGLPTGLGLAGAACRTCGAQG